eukprot:TRINITY_DN3647_c0_g1_i1.p1 TRINITY_DN3647_c0_g1~~TRINITY_DN3647_c0_g1_i1.p1  ORF type:complete len:539 (+),score=175.51 TRINITY_DN3647_c0_g1_i1:44-1660(+)
MPLRPATTDLQRSMTDGGGQVSEAEAIKEDEVLDLDRSEGGGQVSEAEAIKEDEVLELDLVEGTEQMETNKAAVELRGKRQGKLGIADVVLQLKERHKHTEQKELEELRLALAHKTWSLALASVAKMEQFAITQQVDEVEAMSLPHRIAALEVAVFGASLSEADLAKHVRFEEELKKAEKEHAFLLKEHHELLQTLDDRVNEMLPKVEEDDEASHTLKKFLKLSQEKCRSTQFQLRQAKVEALQSQLQTREELEKSLRYKKDLQEMRKNVGSKHRVLQGQHVSMCEELHKLRASHLEMEKEVEQLRKENQAFWEDDRRAKEDPNHPVYANKTLQAANQDLRDELQLVKDQLQSLQKKYDVLRKKLAGDFAEAAKAMPEMPPAQTAAASRTKQDSLPARKVVVLPDAAMGRAASSSEGLDSSSSLPVLGRPSGTAGRPISKSARRPGSRLGEAAGVRPGSRSERPRNFKFQAPSMDKTTNLHVRLNCVAGQVRYYNAQLQDLKELNLRQVSTQFRAHTAGKQFDRSDTAEAKHQFAKTF